jgi:aminopeptidase N
MVIIGRIVCILLLSLPSAALAQGMRYSLDISINVSDRKITGKAHLVGNGENTINLSLKNLHNLFVDGKPVTPDNHKRVAVIINNGKTVDITFETRFPESGDNRIDPDYIFLMDNWYPVPDIPVEYSFNVSLPKNFIAISEAEKVQITEKGDSRAFLFEFKHPLEDIHLAASTRYSIQREIHNGITIETCFFKEHAQLSQTYIEHSKKYLDLYENLLSPYPYKRFAIVESIFPTGISLPTFTLLGKDVIKLPFIVNTSLGHELLHQWFGNSVYVDAYHGNWSEGLTTYLSDHLFAEQKKTGRDYRKQIMVDYAAYVQPETAIPVRSFHGSRNKPQNLVGYGKTAMIFHMLRERFGDDAFFAAIRLFIDRNNFRKASWHDIQRSFERVSGDNLYPWFGYWLNGKSIPAMEVKNDKIEVDQGRLVLKFDLIRKNVLYPLSLPVTIYSQGGESRRRVVLKDSKAEIAIPLDEAPMNVVVDENYSMMRSLHPDEVPPTLASVMGSEKLTAVVNSKLLPVYRPLFDSLGVKNIQYVNSDKITFDMTKNNSLIIAGFDNPLASSLFGKQNIPDTGVGLKVYKNPYSPAKRILLAHVLNKKEAEAVSGKIPHYGKYTELSFNKGKNTFKRIAATKYGIPVDVPAPTVAIKSRSVEKIDDIITELNKNRIIFLGENHDEYSHHINQLQIIKLIHRSGQAFGVGMEMFQTPFQNILDDYMSGRIDERAFLSKSKYFEKWEFDYNLYKPIIDYLKENKIPVVALNIEGDISRKTARKGIENLTDEEKSQVAGFMDFSNEQYRKDLLNVFDQHGHRTELSDFDYFLQAQILWDEGMAETAQRFLEKNPGHKLVMLTGNGHVRYKYGIPDRLYARVHEPFAVVVQDDQVAAGIADYVLMTTKIEGRGAPKLGARLMEKEDKLRVSDVIHNGPAQKAGMKKGDIIEAFNEFPIKSTADLKVELFFSAHGRKVPAVIIRDGKRMEKNIELFAF